MEGGSVSDNILLNWALHYRRQGLSIFPVREKLPLVKWKEYQTNAATEDQIKAWWTQWPDADIGCATGKITGRLVLDIDGPEGRASVAGKALPACPSVRTRRGIQYHYRMPDSVPKTTVAGVLPGVDTRGEGGYVKMPPSLCTDGTHYAWIPGRGLEVPLAEPPQWLLELLSKPDMKAGFEKVAETTKEKWLLEMMDGVGDGQRHHAMAKLAGYYFSHLPTDLAEAHLIQWNAKNHPPIEMAEFRQQLTDMKRRYGREYKETVKYETPNQMASMELADFLTKGSANIDWLVPGLIPKKSCTILGGLQGLGKSWMALDLALEMVQGGGNWLGYFPVDGGSVLYIDEESADQLLRFRIRKLITGKENFKAKFNFRLAVQTGLCLNDAKSVDNLRKILAETRPKMMFVDSLIRSHTADENSASQMKLVFRTVRALMEEFDTAMMFIDHERKPSQFDTLASQRLRGSSEKAAFIDTLISLRKKGQDLLVEHSKSRYARPTPTFGVSITDVTDHAIQVKHIGAYSEAAQ